MEMVQIHAGENKGHYSPGVISNGTLYISGQLSLDLDTREVVKGGIKEHLRQCLLNVERVLHAAGATKEDVVFCRVYITGMKYWDEANEEYNAFFGNHKPARIVISTNELHFGCMAEVEAIAELKEERC
ncbi:putative translation initiation inhibitor [Lachnospiraceae bacterium TWA4]|nr:putative translation initiation inhibitor [Lachnospiraceae bacterium TWA4]